MHLYKKMTHLVPDELEALAMYKEAWPVHDCILGRYVTKKHERRFMSVAATLLIMQHSCTQYI